MIVVQFVPETPLITGVRYLSMISPEINTNFSSSRVSESPGQAGLRSKRVAVVVFSHYPSDPRPRRAAEALVESGMQVDVISLKQDINDPKRDTFNGVTILRIPLKHRRAGKLAYLFQYALFILVSFILLAFRCLTRRYSIVHVHNMPDVLVFAALVPKACGAKVILDLHDPMPELMTAIYGLEQESCTVRLMKLVEKWSIGFADIVLTPNAAFQRLFASRSCGADKLRIVMNSPDENIFKYKEPVNGIHAERAANKPFVIMYHGALVERHGLDLAVDALESLRQSVPNAELRVYGRATPFLQEVMQRVRARGMSKAARYFGSRTLDEIAAAIDDCDVGVIPNRRSIFTEINLPTRIFEYLARGKPVIAARTVGIQDYFNGDDLIFFEHENCEDLARKLFYVYSHPREANETVKRGQAVYRAHLWSEERSGLLTLVAELLNGTSKPGLAANAMLNQARPIASE